MMKENQFPWYEIMLFFYEENCLKQTEYDFVFACLY